MKPSAFALLLSSVIAGAAFATNALAVDTITSGNGVALIETASRGGNRR